MQSIAKAFDVETLACFTGALYRVQLNLTSWARLLPYSVSMVSERQPKYTWSKQSGFKPASEAPVTPASDLAGSVCDHIIVCGFQIVHSKLSLAEGV